jgi:hypothetical protein
MTLTVWHFYLDNHRKRVLRSFVDTNPGQMNVTKKKQTILIDNLTFWHSCDDCDEDYGLVDCDNNGNFNYCDNCDDCNGSTIVMTVTSLMHVMAIRTVLYLMTVTTVSTLMTATTETIVANVTTVPTSMTMSTAWAVMPTDYDQHRPVS